MNSPQTRDFLCNLTDADPPAQEFWATGNNVWVLVLPVLFVVALVIGAIVIL